MSSTPVEIPAAARARWLAEVAEMLDQAERLVNRLGCNGQQGAIVAELELRIRAAKGEIESLRMSRPPRAQFEPDWIISPPWDGKAR